MIFFNVREAQWQLLNFGMVYTLRHLDRDTGQTMAAVGTVEKYIPLCYVTVERVCTIQTADELAHYLNYSGFDDTYEWFLHANPNARTVYKVTKKGDLLSDRNIINMATDIVNKFKMEDVTMGNKHKQKQQKAHKKMASANAKSKQPKVINVAFGQAKPGAVATKPPAVVATEQAIKDGATSPVIDGADAAAMAEAENAKNEAEAKAPAVNAAFDMDSWLKNSTKE